MAGRFPADDHEVQSLETLAPDSSAGSIRALMRKVVAEDENVFVRAKAADSALRYSAASWTASAPSVAAQVPQDDARRTPLSENLLLNSSPFACSATWSQSGRKPPAAASGRSPRRWCPALRTR